MTDNIKIYQQLRYSIRKIDEDEIEIRHSMLDGYGRGLFRILFIGIILTGFYFDITHHRPILTTLKKDIQAIQEDFTWAFNPDKEIKPMYEDNIKFETDPEMIKKYNITEKPMSYKEYKKEYIEEYHRWDFLQACSHIVWISLLLLVLFLPRPRGLRLNRKHRIIYTKLATAPVPDKGDPLSALVYDRFGLYLFGKSGLFGMFGDLQHFSLSMTLYGQKTHPIPITFGVYPTPNKNHNLYLIKAIREYFNEENPEFLDYITHKYRLAMPWQNPMMFFCNVFALPSLFSYRKMKNNAIERLNNEWINISENQKEAFLHKMQLQQQTINDERKAYGFNNEVNNDWTEIDNSPAKIKFVE